MKKKYNLLVLPAIIVIAVCIFSGFTGQNDTGNVKTLLEERTQVLQKGYYGQLKFSEVEKKLQAIETYPLLTEDVKNLKEWEASQLDMVDDMHFIKVEKQRNLMGYQTYNVMISWDMLGLSENYTTQGNYHVVLKKEGSHYKLSQFDPQ